MQVCVTSKFKKIEYFLGTNLILDLYRSYFYIAELQHVS